MLDALEPTPEQIKAFLAHKQADQAVIMLNLLKFKDKASYKDGEDISGRDAYQRYIHGFNQINASKADLVFGGNMNTLLIGSGDIQWDAVVLVKYENAASMIEAVSSEAYRKIYKHRKAGLESQLLISCDDTTNFFKAE